ncbi:MAG: (2Fe-2S)-binding protein [Anaerolineales bacterium]|nr:(2Fe-2S)-binding protein [Chloroflexota bacterium]MBL6981853.1 (2Fe-2S)-binding protein [Anaerolineales bacterium]
MKSILVSFKLNGKDVTVSCASNHTLLDVLRNELALPGTKDACSGEGECGACTVIMDGAAVNSCLVFIGQVGGRSVETIEGLVKNGDLHPLQRAFVEAGAVQCGYCTPGMIMASKALLDQNPTPNDAEIREGLSGNLCRCTGYVKIVDAVRIAAQEMAHG